MDQARATVNELRSCIAEQVPTTPPLGDDAENLEQEEDEGFNLKIGDDSDGEQELQPPILEQDLTACGNLKWQQRQVRITGQQALWAHQCNYMDQVMALTKAVKEARFRSYLSQVLPGPLHPSSLPRPLHNDKKGQKMHLQLALGGGGGGNWNTSSGAGKENKKKEKRRKGSRCCSSCRKTMYGLRQFRDQTED
jgi:hypothetical protein